MDKQTKSGMPVDESKYSFTIPRTDEPREKILKLGAMITDRIGKVTGNDPEYWGLAGVVTDEMADVALKMKVRKPKTTAQIAALTGKSEEELEKLLTEMAYADLLREAAADVGNDHRLGANEAPPAIVSIYLGEQLQDVLSQLISTGEATHSISGKKLETGVKTLPDFMKDATDRNRTSPFAFTGNKFEFRMVGSQDSIAQSNVVLNTIVAEAFAEACDVLEKADDFDMAVHDLIKEYATEHQRIVFNGNGYSDEWVAEAEKRGLPNIRSMVDAIPALNTEKAVTLFEKFKVFTKAELDSRVEIEYQLHRLQLCRRQLS